jgi:YidC/Oxa1 family membrane protein insertase
MGNLRPVLLIGLGLLAYMLWLEWQKDYPAGPSAQQGTTATSTRESAPPLAGEAVGDQDLPEAPHSGQPHSGQPDSEQRDSSLPDPSQLEEPADHASGAPPEMEVGNPTIRVTTDVLQLEISLQGGTVVDAWLLKYPQELEKPQDKVNLLHSGGDQMFIAQSGLLSRQAAPNHTAVYTSTQAEFHLAEGADEIQVPLTWRSDEGLEVTKTFVLKRGLYDITVTHRLQNSSGNAWTGNRYDQLQQAVDPEEKTGGFTNPGSYSFKGIAFYSPEDKFEKIKFSDVADDPYDKTFSGGWLAMIQHYFFAAWIPAAEERDTYSTQVISKTGLPRFIARAVSPAQSAPTGGHVEFSSRLYLGPKLQDTLAQVAPGLEHTVNYGIFTVFSKPLFWLLAHIHSWVGNWGWAIVLLTVLVKAAFFKLTETQYKSMARMRKLQPRIEQLKERYGDDRQKMSLAMMELYKTEKANPLAGCLPMLVQIPVFIALYWVLLESVELRQAPFILWVTNLSARDPYFVLPLLNAVFMIATQRLTPTAGMDPLQRKMMNMMPVVFSVMFAFFPAGLVLYWATNAGLSLAQQLYITKKIAAGEK